MACTWWTWKPGSCCSAPPLQQRFIIESARLLVVSRRPATRGVDEGGWPDRRVLARAVPRSAASRVKVSASECSARREGRVETSEIAHPAAMKGGQGRAPLGRTQVSADDARANVSRFEPASVLLANFNPTSGLTILPARDQKLSRLSPSCGDVSHSLQQAPDSSFAGPSPRLARKHLVRSRRTRRVRWLERQRRALGNQRWQRRLGRVRGLDQRDRRAELGLFRQRFGRHGGPRRGRKIGDGWRACHGW